MVEIIRMTPPCAVMGGAIVIFWREVSNDVKRNFPLNFPLKPNEGSEFF